MRARSRKRSNIAAAIHAMYPAGWVRVASVRRIPRGLEIEFGIHANLGLRGGKKIDGWIVRCLGLHEAKICDFDGGGIAIYDRHHPAARQYSAPQARLRWEGKTDEGIILGALYQAHTALLDDWIPLDRYVTIRVADGSRFECRGPDFLLRRYDKALRGLGETTRLTVSAGRRIKRHHPKVLHFGSSYVVANEFTADRR